MLVQLGDVVGSGVGIELKITGTLRSVNCAY